MTTPLLSIQKLEAAYGQIVALKGIDLDVMPGEIVTVIGANGAGKSTTMMSVFGRPPARAGKIFFDGRDITGLPAHEIARMGLAQSPEGRRIFPRMSVFENLQMGAAVDGMRHFQTDLERMFDIFPRLKERIDQRGGTLSGSGRDLLASPQVRAAYLEGGH